MMYQEAVSEIMVFKTNIREDGEVESIGRSLNCELRIKRWNIDRNDVDNVLRIEAEHLEADHIIRLVQRAGFACEELPD